MNLRVLAFTAILTGAIVLPSFALSAIPEGLWKTTCLDGLQKSQQIAPGFVKTRELFHQDRLCTKPSFEFVTSGAISFPHSSDERNFVDFTYTQIELKLFHEFLVEDFNLRQVCGFTDWQIQTAKTITGLQCALFNLMKPSQIPKVGKILFGIYKVEDEKLYYGKLSKEKDSSTPDRRPEEYDILFYQK